MIAELGHYALALALALALIQLVSPVIGARAGYVALEACRIHRARAVRFRGAARERVLR
jgi:cytochrome c biogenesis factor